MRAMRNPGAALVAPALLLAALPTAVLPALVVALAAAAARVVVVVVAGAALLAGLACTRSGAPAAKKRSITIGITQEPDTLWMPMKQMNASEHIGRPGALSLTVFDERWQLVPQAAVEIPTLENGGLELFEEAAATRMRATWRLKDGLFWADGQPVTADDFVFTWQLYKDDRLEIVDRTVSDRVLQMEAPDPRTLIVTFSEPYAYYAVFRNHEVLPRHLVEPIWKAKGAGLKEDRFGTVPVLGGAFTIAEWVPGSHIVARRNPHAVTFKPKLDEIVWRIIPQTTTLEANLLSGSIDAISVIGLTFDQALALEKRLPERFELRITEALHLEHIDLNLENPILKDRRVREALLWAADRQAVVDTLFGGRLEVAHAGEPARSVYYNPEVPRRTFDPARARALLEEAGWLPGAGGVRQKDGTPLRLTLTTTSGDKVRELVEEILVASWRSVGIDVVVQNQPAKILFGDTMRHRKFDGMVMFTWSKDPVQINEALWRCDQIPREDNGWRGQNFPGYCNPSLDVILKAMTRELDVQKRQKLGRELERILADDLPMLPLYFRAELSVVPRGFVGWRPTGLLQSMAWNAHEWEWPEVAGHAAPPAGAP
jgi:peptide/nickel transport system substrate-binding protein